MSIKYNLKRIIRKIPQINKVVTERNDYAHENIFLHHTLNNKNNQITELTDNMKNLEKSYDILITTIENYELQISILHNEVEKLEKEKSDINSINKSLEKELLEYRNKFNGSFNSKEFWDNHYKNGFTSGTGSYNHLAEFKAQVINTFVKEHNIKDIIEFGCGDGEQLSLMKYPKYTGIDVSNFIIEKNKNKFREDTTKQFFTVDSKEIYMNKKYELALSLDVVFHLCEDDVFDRYMKDLFESSRKYVIIYSSNHEEFTRWPEFRHRKFMKYIFDHCHAWELEQFIPNKYSYEIGYEENTSASDFYIFRQRNIN